MKTKLFTLILLLGSVVAFAQNSTAQQAASAEDEAAIKKVVEAGTTAAYAKDIPAYKNQWANAPYISRINAGTEGKVTKIVGEEFQKAYEDWEKNGKPIDIKVSRDNWLIRVNGNSAFVVFDQHNQNPDGTTRESVEERYMERINNKWKIVSMTILPKK